MRILLIANTLPPADLSGVGEQVLQLAAGLRALGHEVEVLGRQAGGARGPKLLFPLTVVAPALRSIWRFRPHVVQVHESDGAMAALALAVVRPLLSPPPVLAALLQVSYLEERRAVRRLAWEGETLGKPGRAELRFRWFKAPLQAMLGCLSVWVADVVLAPSRRTAAEIERDYGVAPTGVVPNATGGLDGGAESSAAELPVGPYLLFVGRLRIRKGLEVLLHALSRARGEAPEACLLVAGDGEHRAALERTADGLGLGTAVRFLGRRSRAEVRRLLAGCTGLVVPSIYEGMPLVILEAMEAGAPVIASAVSGIPEVVVNGETGWLVPPEDPSALSAALVELSRRPEEARRRGAAGRRRLEARYRPESAARLWLDAVGGPGTGPEPAGREEETR